MNNNTKNINTRPNPAKQSRKGINKYMATICKEEKVSF